MKDLISRKEAIEAMEKSEWGYLWECEQVINVVKALPSAEPERKKGEWIYDTERVMGDGWTYNQYHCSECGQQIIGAVRNFCPNCGVEMEHKR